MLEPCMLAHLPALPLVLLCAGSNCLANPRDFASPVAWYEDHECSFTVMHKVRGGQDRGRREGKGKGEGGGEGPRREGEAAWAALRRRERGEV